MVLPDKATDLPVQGLKQFDGERTDRLNDLTQHQAKEKQQELREAEANNEVKDEEACRRAHRRRHPEHAEDRSRQEAQASARPSTSDW